MFGNPSYRGGRLKIEFQKGGMTSQSRDDLRAASASEVKGRGGDTKMRHLYRDMGRGISIKKV